MRANAPAGITPGIRTSGAMFLFAMVCVQHRISTPMSRASRGRALTRFNQRISHTKY